MDHVNYVAVVVATIAAWAFGAFWYRAFITRWSDALGKTKDQILPGGRRPIRAMVVSFLAELVMAAVLAHLVPVMGPVSLLGGLFTAGACWLGFVLTILVVDNGYANDRPAFVSVASWHWLGVLLIMGGVIGAFG